MARKDSQKTEDLSVTALYTSQVWGWGNMPNARLFKTPEAPIIFGVVNAALAVMRLFRWKLKSLKHSLLHRHAMIDQLVLRSECPNILELACGLSRRGATVTADRNLHYTEVDLPHVVEKKRELLASTAEGQSILERPNLKLVAADVLETPMSRLMEQGGRQCVVSEGLVMYLEPNQQKALWAGISTALSARGGGLYIFDLVPWVEQPRSGVLGRALEWLMKRFTGGKGFERDLRTRHDIAEDLKQAGFTKIELLEPQHVAQTFELPYPDTPTQQLIYVCTQ